MKGAANTLAALSWIRVARPDGAPIYVIKDNLSAHKGADIRRWAKKTQGRVVLHADLSLVGEPDRGALRTAEAVHHRQLQPPGADPGPACLHAVAQHQRVPRGALTVEGK